MYYHLNREGLGKIGDMCGGEREEGEEAAFETCDIRPSLRREKKTVRWLSILFVCQKMHYDV